MPGDYRFMSVIRTNVTIGLPVRIAPGDLIGLPVTNHQGATVFRRERSVMQSTDAQS